LTVLLEEVRAAEDDGVSLGLVTLDKQRGGVVVWLYTPRGLERNTSTFIFWTYIRKMGFLCLNGFREQPVPY